jgi:hypothetical protein
MSQEETGTQIAKLRNFLGLEGAQRILDLIEKRGMDGAAKEVEVDESVFRQFFQEHRHAIHELAKRKSGDDEIERFTTFENAMKYRDLCRQGLSGPEIAKAMGVDGEFLRRWLAAKLDFVREISIKQKLEA